ncbi:putative exosome complex exonuclease rrp6 [Phaeomoniella chlamydospora]|uniref:Putative exosome complex exonuclease rrp6 n=1 Tax=Phaeomoniella chlamydospora TaxID=158046 RepID=A0A0G2GNM9_PHACM|nr:putative exosome complex exonuclease rrp6 [Phaeomoniella chlamydospora]
MDLSADFNSFQKTVTDALLASTRTAGQIASEDLSFHRSSSRSFSSALDAKNVRLLQLTNRLLQVAASASTSDVSAPQLEDVDSVEDNWRGVVDVVDDLLEKADRCLDEFTGVIKQLSPKKDGEDVGQAPKQTATKPNRYLTKVMKKPQEEFESKVNNFEEGPWKPLLKSKPHAKVSLEESLVENESGFDHPYAPEIADYSYPQATYKFADAITFTPPQESEAIFVDTEEGVNEMLEELQQADVIAVDLEHHDAHSYVGLVSLMQISTRGKDWIVDTLRPWRERLQVLNEVFTDPKILKVFHGSTMDMIWLQRDLGLYVVGLFDTYHAACALNFPKKSLKYLLERFAQFDAQKMYQMSDWRIRPLPAELLDYARSDTHYLLYVFDQVRNMLIEESTNDNNLVDYVLEQSKKEALQKYERPVYDRDRGLGPVGWFGPISKRSVKFTNEQFAVYRALHEWRDMEARNADEGVGTILSINALFNVADAMPTTTHALLAAASPISRAVRDSLKDLVDLIKRAKEDSKNQPAYWQIMQEIDTILGPTRKSRKPWEREKQNKDVLADTNGNVETVNVMGTTAASATTSTLWGPTIHSADLLVKQNWKNLVMQETMARIIPMPTAAQVISMITPPTLTQLSIPASTSAPPTPITTNGTDSKPSTPEVFTIRELKRQEKENRKSATAAEENISLDPKEITKSERKALREQERAQREQKKKQKGQESSPATEFFDYKTAPSILHPPQADEPTRNHKQSPTNPKKRPFDPYLKSLDTKKGAKRLHGEGGGKSFTFKK